MNADSTLITVPVSQLQLSPRNVRKTGGASIDDLAASIRGHGLEQNLVVVAVNGHYEVAAGGRRLQALQQLDQDGQLPESLAAGVPCLVVEDHRAYEASLAENTIRQAMHPADEFEAFRTLIDGQGLAIAELAERFGKATRYVEQRLRLGNVAPKLLDEYRAGNANLDQMMALAIVDDHEAQMRVWEAASHGYFREPNQLRDALVERDVSLRSPIGAFVGVEDYEAAGGEARRDLFSEFVTLPDSKLVQRLAKKKLEAEAEKVRTKGWGWVESMPAFKYAERSKYRQRVGAAPSEKLGAVVTIGSGGKVEVVAGLLKPGERAPAGSADKKKTAAKQTEAARATTQTLVGIRTGVLRATLRQDRDLALCTLAAALACDYFQHLREEPTSAVLNVELGAYNHATQEAGLKIADPTGESAHKNWQQRLTDGAKKTGSVLAWLRTQREDVVIDLLAHLAADAVDSDTWDDDKDVFAYAEVFGLDLAAAWPVTQEWLAKQPKAYILESVTDAVGKEAATALEKSKPKDLTAEAFNMLVAASWVPPQFRDPRAPSKPKPVAKKAVKKPKSVSASSKKSTKKASAKKTKPTT